MPVLDPNQNPVTTTSTPVLQDWGFSPATITVDHYIGEAVPAPFTVATTFKDVMGTGIAQGYTNVKYKTYLMAPDDLTGICAMSGPLYTNGALVAYNNGISDDMVYTFANLNVLLPDTYNFIAHHEIRGMAPGSDAMTLISQATFNLKLRVFPATAPQFSPSPIVYNWILSSAGPLASAALTITTSGDWVIKSPPGFYFNDPGGVTLVQPAPWGGAEMSGTGNKTFTLAMFASVVPEVITQNPMYFNLELNGGILQVPIQVNFLQPSGMFLETQSLHFVAYKGISNANPQFVHIYWPGTYDFVVPPWLEIFPHPASYNMNCGFYVLSADNMEPGVYEFDVVITNEAGTETLGTIHVVYEVIGAIISPYPADGHAYTLDRDFLEFSSQYDNTYFEMQLNVRAYDFYSQAYKDYSYPFKIALFNRRQQFNIGQVVHRLMADMPGLIQEGPEPYFPAEVSLDVKEKSSVDPDFLNEYQVSNIQFIAGLRPQLSAGCGFLDINPGASRVTPSAYYFLNCVVKNYPVLEIYKNGTLANYFGITEGLRTLKLDFANNGAAPGDVFEYRLVTPAGSVSKFFKVIPESFESNYIIWENEYKLKGTLECTGDYKLASEFENRTQTLFLKLVDVLAKLESTKVCRLTINTGWLLKSDIASIESLMRAKRAALLQGDRVINLVPTSKSITNTDNRRELISFDLEFEINRQYNEEIYML